MARLLTSQENVLIARIARKGLRAGWSAVFILCILLSLKSRAASAFQFDVFVGYDGMIHEAGWFPVTFEIYNDGPGFNAVLEIASGQFATEQLRQAPVELPSNTRKRIVIPMFAGMGHNISQWEAKLIDSSGKVREKRSAIQVKQVHRDSVLMGAMPRNFGGMPILPAVKQQRLDYKPEVARLQLEQFPDNPIALEGLNTFYLNTEKALELKVPQVMALLGWVRSGGHLIIGVEQIADVNATPWLQQFLPIEFSGTATVPIEEVAQGWLRNSDAADDPDIVGGINPRRPGMGSEGSPYLTAINDPNFKNAEVVVATGKLRDGRPMFSNKQIPLAVQAPRGRGTITTLCFSPEREPFRTWKNRNYFWAKLCRIPGEVFIATDYLNNFGGWSIDGVFGALIDSRQIKKLPVEWLLALLLVYLVVIGPFDQWWLKKINRQMLTWITFPIYVALFSGLIYFIGYKLRAGETEWNELNVVDVLPRADKADLRGRTYVSIYSSANQRYPVVGDEGYSTLRAELLDMTSGTRENKAKVVYYGNGYKAEVFVPVWTSLLYEDDWMKTNDIPFGATVRKSVTGWTVDLENFMDQALSDLRMAVGNYVFELPTLAANEKKTVNLSSDKGQPIHTFVLNNGNYFQRAVEARKNPLGDTAGGYLENRALTATVASLYGFMDQAYQGRSIIAPRGLDLSPLVTRGDAVLFAFLPNQSFLKPLNQFKPPRLKRDTLLRLSVPVKKA